MMIGARAAIQGVTIQVHAEIQDRGGRSGHTAVIRPYNPLLIASRRCSAASWFGIYLWLDGSFLSQGIGGQFRDGCRLLPQFG